MEIKADMHGAANNWGNTLANEAQAVAENGDLDTASELWKTAREKYQQALKIKKDDDKAAYNWLLTLEYEAAYLSDTDQI